MTICRSCETPLQDAANFCAACGAPVSGGAEPWRAGVIEALRGGQKIEAIQRYRNATGMGLAEAKTVVDALAKTISTGEMPDGADSNISGELVELVRNGEFIAAIRRYREVTGCGLAEAKIAVEALAQEAGVVRPKNAGAAVVAVTVAFLIAAAVAGVVLLR